MPLGTRLTTSVAWIVAPFFLSGCGKQETAGATGGPAARVPALPVVEVDTVVPRLFSQRIPIIGTLFAAEEAVISTRTAGILRRTFVDVGNPVRPDEPLAQVDTSDYEVAVKQADASLAESLARLGVSDVPDESFDRNTVSIVERASAQLENARFSFDRLTRLSENLSTVSEQEMNDASARLRSAEAEYRFAIDEAAALVAAARERQSLLQMAWQKLANTQTKTPPIPSTLGKAGAEQWIVSARFVTEGQYLNVADPLYRLIVNDPLKLRSKVPERYAADVRMGQEIVLEMLDGSMQSLGTVTRISPSIEPASRTFEIEALIDNPLDALKPGSFARGVVVSETPSPVVCVPVESVLTAGGTTRLFVVAEDVARRRDVRTGRESGGMLEIVSGLNAGERFVIRGAAALTDGAAVQVRAGS